MIDIMFLRVNFDRYKILIRLFPSILYNFEEKTNYNLEIFKIMI